MLAVRLEEQKRMDPLTFIAELAKAFAWPVCVVMLVYLFRHSLQALVPTIRKLKYKGFEADFTRDLEQAEIEAQKVSLATSDEAQRFVVGVPELAVDKYRRLADASPRAAVMEAWRDVEVALSAVATGYDWDDPQNDRYPNIGNVLSRLVREGTLDEGSRHFLDHLRRLRNQAAHARDVDLNADEALQFALLATRIVARVKRTQEEK